MASKEGLDDKDREILLWVTLGLSYDVRIFSERLRQEIDRLTRSGVSQQSIAGILNSDLNGQGRIFGELRNAIKRGIIGGVNQAFRRAGEMGQKLRWVAVSRDLLSRWGGKFNYGDTIVIEHKKKAIAGRWVIHDTMNKRFKNRSSQKVLQFY